jgi:hypothetical protein
MVGDDRKLHRGIKKIEFKKNRFVRTLGLLKLIKGLTQ